MQPSIILDSRLNHGVIDWNWPAKLRHQRISNLEPHTPAAQTKRRGDDISYIFGKLYSTPSCLCSRAGAQQYQSQSVHFQCATEIDMSYHTFAVGGASGEAKDIKEPPSGRHRRPVATRRGSTSFACVECRRRKIRCDGTKPCQQCLWYGLPEQCEYPRLVRKSAPSRT